jgi:hypothetical protein
MTDGQLIALLARIWISGLFLFLIWEGFQYWYFTIDRRTDPQAKPCGGRIYTPAQLFVGGLIALGITFLLTFLYPWHTLAIGLFLTCIVIVFVGSCHHEYRTKVLSALPREPPKPGEISEAAKKIIDELSKRP